MITADREDALERQVRQLSADGNFSNAFSLLDSEIESAPTAGLYFLRGRLRWKTGNKSGAISDYCAATELEPDSPAAEALEMSRRVMDFYHHDLYNP